MSSDAASLTTVYRFCRGQAHERNLYFTVAVTKEMLLAGSTFILVMPPGGIILSRHGAYASRTHVNKVGIDV